MSWGCTILSIKPCLLKDLHGKERKEERVAQLYVPMRAAQLAKGLARARGGVQGGPHRGSLALRLIEPRCTHGIAHGRVCGQ
eukprot:1142018-Pelagomonas_calceolata.AAC.5